MEVNGVKLKTLREERAWSMRDLADEAGISYHTIYRLEHGQGKAIPRTIRRLAHALEISPRVLMEEDA
jgi:transcriptional regulator with XRE-family HTH domain